MISWIQLSSTCSSRNSSAIWIALRPVRNQVGERCSMVTWRHSSAMAGTIVAAVAPEPMTRTFLPR